MKMTWNTLHNWRQTSPLWRAMPTIPDKRMDRYTHYLVYNQDGERLCRYLSSGPYKNVWWCAIAREFKTLFGAEFKFYKTVELNETVSVYIHTSINGVLSDDIAFTVHGMSMPYNHDTECESNRFCIRPPGNMEYTPENIRRFVLAWVDKNLLFGKGMFRDVQLRAGMTKKAVVKWYKLRNEYPETDGEPYSETTARRAIARRFNVTGDNLALCEVMAWVNAHGRQSKPIELMHFDTGWMLDIDGDIDEVEKAYWDEVAQYPDNAVFV